MVYQVLDPSALGHCARSGHLLARIFLIIGWASLKVVIKLVQNLDLSSGLPKSEGVVGAPSKLGLDRVLLGLVLSNSSWLN